MVLNDLNSQPVTLGADTYVAVDVIGTRLVDAQTLSAWQSLGLRQAAASDYMASGLVRLSDLPALAASADIGGIQYSLSLSNAGAVPGGAEIAIGTGALNAQGFTGAGVKVGVLSDSYDSLGGANADVASGDLPAGVQIIEEGPQAAADEGRAMLQIVHDIAPDASLAFATAWNGPAGFAANIRALAAAGADVIVDDVRNANQLTFTDDVVSRAIADVTGQGVAYFTSNGNQGTRGVIEVAPVFKPTAQNALLLDFNEATAETDVLTFTADATGNVLLRMTWSSRAPSVHGGTADSDLDFYVVSNGQILGRAEGSQGGGSTLDPVEFMVGPNGNGVPVVAGQTYEVHVFKFAGQTPTHVQISYHGGAKVSFNAPGVDEFSAAFGHSFAPGGVSVSAVSYQETVPFGGLNKIESFSTYGRGYLTHDAAGNALAAPQVRLGAEISSIDDINTTFFGQDTDGDGRPNFTGTSAAAPSAAAVAALLLQQNPGLTSSQLLALLQGPADPVTGTGLFDPGAGLIDPAASVLLGFQGTSGRDTINGANNADSIFGYAADDTLSGGAGNDSLYGGAGADVLDGGAGFDYARYDDSAASGVTAALFAPSLNTGAAAGDTYVGIEGLILTANADAGYGSNGNDTLQGLDGNDNLYGQGGADTILGGAGNDLLWGGLGADFHDGGAGFDYVRYDDASFPSLTAALFAPSLNTGAAAGDTYANVEGLILGFFDDKGYGSNSADYVYGINGNDSLYGQGGDDHVYGGSGNDLLWGGLGADVLDGGDGFDYARYDDATFPSLVASLSTPSLNTGAAQGDTYFNLEGLILGYFDDTGYGAAAGEYLYGINGNDTLYGLAGNDNLAGGSGNDTLVGGEGNDNLTGEAGSDVFRFEAALSLMGVDVVADFLPGTDKLHLENGVFTSLGTAGTLAAGNFRSGANVVAAADANDFIIYNSANGDLYYDSDGSGAAAAVKFAVLTGAPALGFADIVVT